MRAYSNLYSPLDPYDQRNIDVGDGHRVYVEQCGNPNGIPVIVLHGGPGGGCSPFMRRFFNPETYRIILFDQRGCGRSTPRAGVEHNTTWHLVADIERIREMLELGQVCVFGGSWGATLALIYAQTHPAAVRHIILRGVFLMTQPELDWFYGGGAGHFWPEAWTTFKNAVPQDEQDDLIAAYHKRLFSGHLPTENKFGGLWSQWENALASINNNGQSGIPPDEYARTFARLENHYFVNKGFLEPSQHILNNMHKIAHIPGYIVQGRMDMICPPHTAWSLAQQWPDADLRMIPMAGHAMSEMGISRELVRIMDQIGEMEREVL